MPTQQEYNDAMALKYTKFSERFLRGDNILDCINDADKEINRLSLEVKRAQRDNATVRLWNAALVDDKAYLRSAGSKVAKDLRNEITTLKKRANMFEVALRIEQKIVDRYSGQAKHNSFITDSQRRAYDMCSERAACGLKKIDALKMELKQAKQDCAIYSNQVGERVRELVQARQRSSVHEEAFLLAAKQRGDLVDKLYQERKTHDAALKHAVTCRQDCIDGLRRDLGALGRIAASESQAYQKCRTRENLLIRENNDLRGKLEAVTKRKDAYKKVAHNMSYGALGAAKIMYDPEVNILRKRIGELNTEATQLSVKLSGAQGKIAHQRETIAHLQSNPLMHISPDGKPITIYHAYPAKCWFPCNDNSCKVQS